jgi:nicotinamide mononucleotide (NMN) deamidase PncC
VAQLRPYIYTDDPVVTLEQHVEMHLLRRGWKLAVAEVGTGGALAAGLSTPRGAASVFIGAHMATTEAAMNRLLGLGEGAPLQAVAEAAARHTGTECAIAVGQATEDERGGRWVTVAYHLPGLDMPAQRIALRGDDTARAAAVTQILDQLRRRLSEQK